MKLQFEWTRKTSMWMVESELKEIVIDNNIKYSNILYIMHMYIYIYIYIYIYVCIHIYKIKTKYVF